MLSGAGVYLDHENGTNFGCSRYANLAPLNECVIDGDKGFDVVIGQDRSGWGVEVNGLYTPCFSSKRHARAHVPIAAAVIYWQLNQEAAQVKAIIETQC